MKKKTKCFSGTVVAFSNTARLCRREEFMTLSRLPEKSFRILNYMLVILFVATHVQKW